jgi:hypothetical protein
MLQGFDSYMATSNEKAAFDDVVSNAASYFDHFLVGASSV